MNGFCLKGKCTCNEGFSSEDCSIPSPLLENKISVKACSENNYSNPDNVNELTIDIFIPFFNCFVDNFEQVCRDSCPDSYFK